MIINSNTINNINQKIENLDSSIQTSSISIFKQSVNMLQDSAENIKNNFYNMWMFNLINRQIPIDEQIPSQASAVVFMYQD